MDAQKAFSKIQKLLLIKSLCENIFKYNKNQYIKTNNKHYIKWWNIENILLNSDTMHNSTIIII